MQVTVSRSFLILDSQLAIGNNQLIIFGGMGNTPNSTNVEDLCVLNDIRFLDLSTLHWLPAPSKNGIPHDSGAETHIPKPRYAHLSSVTADRLFIIGGQDLSNLWLDDAHVYDLLGKVWVQRRSFPHHCGTYRSVAVSATSRVRLPQEELRAADTNALLGSPGSRFRSDKSSPSSDCTSPEALVHLPYSAAPTDDFPNDIYLYSNYNVSQLLLRRNSLTIRTILSLQMSTGNSKFSPLFRTQILLSLTDLPLCLAPHSPLASAFPQALFLATT